MWLWRQISHSWVPPDCRIVLSKEAPIGAIPGLFVQGSQHLLWSHLEMEELIRWHWKLLGFFFWEKIFVISSLRKESKNAFFFLRKEAGVELRSHCEEHPRSIMVFCFFWKYWKCCWMAGAALKFFVSLGRQLRMLSEFKRWHMTSSVIRQHSWAFISL